MSYLEIARSVREALLTASNEKTIKPTEQSCEKSEISEIRAECDSPDCAGCYEVGDGKKIHPPKVSREWLEWLVQWEPKGDKE
jgi:hypothetical protein